MEVAFFMTNWWTLETVRRNVSVIDNLYLHDSMHYRLYCVLTLAGNTYTNASELASISKGERGKEEP